MRSRERLDIALVKRSLVATRSRAQDLIRRGLVTVDGLVLREPGVRVDATAQITVDAQAAASVSRAAIKLQHALTVFGFDATAAVALDIGASTGGFTQTLLSAGARKVYALDVGHGQLAPRLVADPRVVNLEGIDARALTPAMIGEPIDALTADVSFISLTLALPAALTLARAGAFLVALVKPQFEAGRAAVGKRGIVARSEDHERAIARVRDFLLAAGWHVIGIVPSPILGGSGNREFLLGARRH
jgi:23S rRNA (cytidine1920-2'-O)/16S rRNA (cytidine1409-2'-O)-methyltransferase